MEILLVGFHHLGEVSGSSIYQGKAGEDWGETMTTHREADRLRAGEGLSFVEWLLQAHPGEGLRGLWVSLLLTPPSVPASHCYQLAWAGSVEAGSLCRKQARALTVQGVCPHSPQPSSSQSQAAACAVIISESGA